MASVFFGAELVSWSMQCHVRLRMVAISLVEPFWSSLQHQGERQEVQVDAAFGVPEISNSRD